MENYRMFMRMFMRWKVGIGVLCLAFLFVGCSSRLQTTVMSGTEPPPARQQQMVMEERVKPVQEEPVQAEKVVGIPPIDIPVEEPALPVIRPEAPKEIFATPRTEVREPELPLSSEPSLMAESEPIPQNPSALPQEAPKDLGIPPAAFEPEMPAFPTIREEIAPAKESPASALSEAPTEGPASPPMEVAKVVSPTPEIVEENLKALEDVFFDYDRFTIREDAISALTENAQSLVGKLGEKDLVIEGHCDERGTSSYNLVLGERRANAVKEFLITLGVPGEKLKTVSFGKERPFCSDHTQECWQENRRGHFVLE